MIKKVLLIILLSLSLSYADDDKEQHHNDESYVIKAPLQNELIKTYQTSKKVGTEAGKTTKNFFCSELHWTFFCKGED